jgi:vitamin B12 transporter
MKKRDREFGGLKVWWMTGLAIAAVEAATAQQVPVIDLETYTVSASRMELPLGEVGSSVTKITAEEVARFAGEMATEVLRHVPGLYLRNTGNLGSAPGITMRGLPVAPLVLIDGIEVNHPGSGNVFNFGNLPIHVIESIEVLRGAQGALYGANALTGVISITTRKGETEQPYTRLGASYGSRNTYQGYASVSQALDWMNYFVTVGHYHTDGFSVQDPSWGPEWADDDLHRSSQLFGKFLFPINESTELGFWMKWMDNKSEFDPGTPSPWSIPVLNNFSTSEHKLLKGELRMQWLENLGSRTSISYHQVDEFAQDHWGIRDTNAELLKADLLFEGQVGDTYRWVGGFEWKRAEDTVGGYRMDTGSVFMENVISFNEDGQVTLAGRYDDNDTFGSKSTWRASTAYRIPEWNLRFKASGGVSYDAPEINQLFGPWGNPGLVSEDGWSYDLGWEQDLLDGAISWSVTWFDIRVEDRIEYLRSTFNFANVDWASRGVEVSIRYKNSVGTQVQLGHTWADAERKRAEDPLLFHSPETHTSLLIDQGLLDDRLLVSLSALWMGARETWDGKTDGYLTMDFMLRYRHQADTEVWVKVENLFDEEYEEILSYRTAGRGFFAGLSFAF